MYIDKVWLVVLAISFFNIGFFTRGIVNGIEQMIRDRQKEVEK